ncbi:phage terminase large subunit [Fimbriiglobus ruber]|uniref:Phage terminase, large subunit n=1 Tax=Fimbriiglobus ruber TaxID=1908690 RepID=A0A225EB50_9BACT|nr:phage terminase large subunit [Fimbriiglobus ruber]OWK46609.1 Phage terminase, large subunit [Fimbriiglobus ruber]
MLTVSHGERLAMRDAAATRDLINHPLYQQYFGGLYTLTADQNAKGFYTTNKMGSRLALGVQSNVSGQNADMILADDILDYDKAKSEVERQNVKDFWTGTLTQRLAIGNNKDRILLIGHRVHEDDVFNLVYDTFGNSGEWTYLVLPAEGNPTVTNSYHNAIGWKDKREEGELLNEERFPREVLDNKKKEMRHKYQCLFNQDPAPSGGDLFKPQWFRHYTEDATHYNLGGKLVEKSKAWRFATVDTAVTVAAHSDYTVCQVWSVIGQDMVLVHQLRKRLDGNRLIPALNEVYQSYQPQFLVIESEFVGKFVQDQLKALNVPVKSFRTSGQGGKETRAVAAEIRVEAGRVWFPSNQPWVSELERELLSFPHGKHDDQVDALAMAAIQADKYLGKLEPELTPEELREKSQREADRMFKEMLFSGLPF